MNNTIFETVQSEKFFDGHFDSRLYDEAISGNNNAVEADKRRTLYFPLLKKRRGGAYGMWRS